MTEKMKIDREQAWRYLARMHSKDRAVFEPVLAERDEMKQLLDELVQKLEQKRRDKVELRKKLRKAERERDTLIEAVREIAYADTHYPSMPRGFTGDWRVLRDLAVKAIAPWEEVSTEGEDE